jgi:hypothetical protein
MDVLKVPELCAFEWPDGKFLCILPLILKTTKTFDISVWI